MGDFLKPKSAAVTKAVEAGLRLFRQYRRGDVVPWHLIEKAAGFERYTQHWTAFLHRTRRTLRDVDHVVLMPVPGVGMRVATVEDQLRELPAKRQRRSARQLHWTRRELEVLPPALLTDRQAEERVRRLELVRSGLRAVRRAARMGAVLTARPTYMPRPAGGAA